MDATRHWHAQYAKHCLSQVLAATTATEVKEVLWCAKAVVAVEKELHLSTLSGPSKFSLWEVPQPLWRVPRLWHMHWWLQGRSLPSLRGAFLCWPLWPAVPMSGQRHWRLRLWWLWLFWFAWQRWQQLCQLGFHLTPRQALQYPLQGVGMDICVE